jgi:hypothetical protein
MSDDPWRLHAYSLVRWPWPRLIGRVLDEPSLTGLAADLPRRSDRDDQQSPWHKAFYDAWATSAQLPALFAGFVRAQVARWVAEPFYWQAVPTFRVQLPGNVAVGTFHTDADYHHPAGEVSFWVPLTAAHDSSSVWIEGDDGLLHAPSVGPGQVVEFSAVSRRHGNQPNGTGRSRVSFDFRCLPVRLLPEVEGPPSEHYRLRFVPGGYYAPEAVAP